MYGQHHQVAANPYSYAQQGLLPQQHMVTPPALLAQQPLIQQTALLHPPQQAALYPQQQALLHPQQFAQTGLLSKQQALLAQQSFTGHHAQSASLLGSPPRMPVNPAILSRALLNQALINNQLKPKLFNRPPYKPAIKPRAQSLKPDETLRRLEKLVPEFERADRFTATSKDFLDLLQQGIHKDTETKFFVVIQKLSSIIGSPEYNAAAVRRVFDGAFAKRGFFTPEESESITKWKAEVDAKNTSELGKRFAEDQVDSPNKKQRFETPVADILLKRVDTLEDEVTKLRDELTQTRARHGKELAQIRLALGIQAPVDEEELPEAAAPTDETVAIDDATTTETTNTTPTITATSETATPSEANVSQEANSVPDSSRVADETSTDLNSAE